AVARNSSSMCSGSDPVWSSFMGSGSGPARASCSFAGSDTGMLTPDVTIDVSM
ncbi:hypothetical protein Tco_1279043, partial [Tanacetum coccineum]